MALVSPSGATETLLMVTGQAGVLGEWELAGTLTGRGVGGRQDFAGDVTLKHIGLCTQDGPETKTATMTLRLSRGANRVAAVMQFDGVNCAFTGRKDHGFHGTMRCADREPVPLILWVR